MKQLFVTAGTTALATAIKDVSVAAKGELSVVDKGDYYSMILYRGANVQPLIMDMVDKKSMHVTKTEYKAAVKYTATITVPLLTTDIEMELSIFKKGACFNERNVWITSVHKTKSVSTAAKMTEELAKQINFSSSYHKLVAKASGATLTITGPDDGSDYVITASKVKRNTTTNYPLYETEEITVTETNGSSGIADVRYVENLASMCAANRGFEYTALEGRDIYPGYPIELPSSVTSYNIYNIRFADRKVIRPTDEPINQLLHIAVGKGSTLDTALDSLFFPSSSDDEGDKGEENG